ncbi:MAG: UvrD-helicase domain-containing protein [Acidobacteriaceae bacterium]
MADVLQFPSLQTSDSEARAAALDTRCSCIVEAPAGSGKTALLVARYLKLLGDAEVEQPEEVLAITFTRKATAELRERVLQQLLQAAARQEADAAIDAPLLSPFDQELLALARAVLQRSSRLGWDLLERPSRLNIRSIDSVCSQIANALPILSGAGGPRQPVEDANLLYRLAARRTLLQLGNVNSPADQRLDAALRTLLLHRDASLANCETLIADMLETREQWGELTSILSAPASTTEEEAALETEIRRRLESALENVVCSNLEMALQALPAGVLQALTSLSARLARHPGLAGAPSPIALCAARQQPPGSAAEDVDHWVAMIGLLLKSDGDWRKRLSARDLKFEIPKADVPALQEILQKLQSHTIPNGELRLLLANIPKLPPVRYPARQWEVAKALFHVLRRALIELRLLFAERGACDFTEFALSARAALRSSLGPDPESTTQPCETPAESSSDLAIWAGARLRHILVDEMQDTSSGQYELLSLLTHFWDGHSQTLFLVGDPKQSIYLFRQARVERFLRIKLEQKLGSLELRSLALTANFRSQANLVSDFNNLFHQIFPSPIPPPADGRRLPITDGADVPFVEAYATRKQTEGAGLRWRPRLRATTDPNKAPSATIAAEEAREIRSIIEQRQATPLPQDRSGKPWTIAVLGRTRSHLRAVIEEFKQDRGSGPLPYRAIDLDALDELPEVLDALALTRALLHPSDRAAWLAVLHAPWCGLGLADLLRLTGDNAASPSAAPDAENLREWTVAELVRARRSLLSSQGQQLLDRVWPNLEAALATRGRTSVATHVERTWRSLGGDAALPEAKRRNVQRYFALLLQVESEAERLDLNLLKSRLAKLYAEPAPLVAEDGRLQVDLLTIHKAKGLEWDLVLIPGLDRGTRNDSGVLLNWMEFDEPSDPNHLSPIDEQTSATVVLAPIDEKGAEKGSLNNWLADVQARRQAAEIKRIFYVAATRAREELYLFATATVTSKGELSQPRYDSLLKACWPAAKQHFDLLLADRAAATDDAELEIAAAASPTEHAQATTATATATIERLPLSYDPSARFRSAEERRLFYPSAAALHHTAAFLRPEGSFAARAFGNVVHRYLQRLAQILEQKALLIQDKPDRLQHHAEAGNQGAQGIQEIQGIQDAFEALAAEIPSWRSALATSLRGEGLSATFANRESARAERALSLALKDPVGRWILSPHPSAASERTLRLAAPEARALRVDRTFLAGSEPNSSGNEQIWIVDFKTTEQGALSDAAFADEEIAKYKEQMEAYACLRRNLPDGDLPIQLGLYYPLIPRLLHWSAASSAEQPSITAEQPS